LGDPAGLRVVEIGAGTGVGAAILASRGASATVLDYSRSALERSRGFFGSASLPGEFVLADALDLPAELRGQFDVCLSFGLAEHFTGDARRRIIAAHMDLLRPGGLAVVSVPNRCNLPYRFFKLAAQRTGRWRVGEEYPFSRGELGRMCRDLGVGEYLFVGDSLFESVRFLIPTRVKLWWARARNRLRLPEPGPLPGTHLDEYLSYSLVLIAVKP
jgi:SAM-dependent methyltransferase